MSFCKFLMSCFLIIGVSVVTSCGDDEDEKDENDILLNEEARQEVEGNYQIYNVTNVNTKIVRNTNVISNVSIYGDQITTRVIVNNAPRAVRHRQYIHEGRRCPDKNDDFNKDGYIDRFEVQQVVGGVLIPLDQDIESQDGGVSSYPRADASGRYFYSQSASFSRTLADLLSPDLNPHDEFIKLPPEEDFNLDGRVVIIYGVSSNLDLPDSVSCHPEEVPIVCGVLQKQANDWPSDSPPHEGTITTGGGSIDGCGSCSGGSSHGHTGYTSRGSTGHSTGYSTGHSTGQTTQGTTGWHSGGTIQGTTGQTTGATSETVGGTDRGHYDENTNGSGSRMTSRTVGGTPGF